MINIRSKSSCDGSCWVWRHDPGEWRGRHKTSHLASGVRDICVTLRWQATLARQTWWRLGGRERSSPANQRPEMVATDQWEASVCPYSREQDAGSWCHGVAQAGPRPLAAVWPLSRVGLAWAGLGCAHHPPSPSVSLCQVCPVSPWWPFTRLTGDMRHQAGADRAEGFINWQRWY